MKRFVISLFAILAATSLYSFTNGHTNTKKARQKANIKLMIIGTEPAQSPQPNPGEKFMIDSETGDLLIDYVTSSGLLQHIRIELANKAKPLVSVNYEMMPSGVVRYSYFVANDISAKQAIRMFSLPMVDPGSLSNVLTSPQWHASAGQRAAKGMPKVFSWWASEGSKAWAPGGALNSPITFDAAALPGLKIAYVVGLTEPPAIAEGMSDWLIGQIGEAARLPNNCVQIYVVGPKIEISPNMERLNIVASVAAELTEVAQTTGFADLSIQMNSLADELKNGSPDNALSIKQRLSLMGNKPYQRAFFEAMVFDLNTYPK